MEPLSDMSLGIILGWASAVCGRLFWQGWKAWRS
jgi:hypothetical protein